VFKYSKTIKSIVALLLVVSFHVSATDYQEISIKSGEFNRGKKASKEEIKGWHIDISPGHNLPPGKGTAADGEQLFDDQCASCHGSFGEGVGRNPVLAGGEGTLKDTSRPERTVGSYWPYASTLLDYTHRAMPFNAPQSLNWDDTWSIAAYVLYLNDVITDEDFVFNADSFAEIIMPNADGFISDQRPDTNNKRCMKDCKQPESIHIIPALLGYASGAEDSINDGKSTTADNTEHKIGKQIYKTHCKLCHANGVAGAPKIDDKATWGERLKPGMDGVYARAINGFTGKFGVMPAKGGAPDLTEAEVKAAVDYMIKGLEQ